MQQQQPGSMQQAPDQQQPGSMQQQQHLLDPSLHPVGDPLLNPVVLPKLDQSGRPEDSAALARLSPAGRTVALPESLQSHTLNDGNRRKSGRKGGEGEKGEPKKKKNGGGKSKEEQQKPPPGGPSKDKDGTESAKTRKQQRAEQRMPDVPEGAKLRDPKDPSSLTPTTSKEVQKQDSKSPTSSRSVSIVDGEHSPRAPAAGPPDFDRSTAASPARSAPGSHTRASDRSPRGAGGGPGLFSGAARDSGASPRDGPAAGTDISEDLSLNMRISVMSSPEWRRNWQDQVFSRSEIVQSEICERSQSVATDPGHYFAEHDHYLKHRPRGRGSPPTGEDHPRDSSRPSSQSDIEDYRLDSSLKSSNGGIVSSAPVGSELRAQRAFAHAENQGIPDFELVEHDEETGEHVTASARPFFPRRITSATDRDRSARKNPRRIRLGGSPIPRFLGGPGTTSRDLFASDVRRSRTPASSSRVSKQDAGDRSEDLRSSRSAASSSLFNRTMNSQKLEASSRGKGVGPNRASSAREPHATATSTVAAGARERSESGGTAQQPPSQQPSTTGSGTTPRQQRSTKSQSSALSMQHQASSAAQRLASLHQQEPLNWPGKEDGLPNPEVVRSATSSQSSRRVGGEKPARGTSGLSAPGPAGNGPQWGQWTAGPPIGGARAQSSDPWGAMDAEYERKMYPVAVQPHQAGTWNQPIGGKSKNKGAQKGGKMLDGAGGPGGGPSLSKQSSKSGSAEWMQHQQRMGAPTGPPSLQGVAPQTGMWEGMWAASSDKGSSVNVNQQLPVPASSSMSSEQGAPLSRHHSGESSQKRSSQDNISRQVSGQSGGKKSKMFATSSPDQSTELRAQISSVSRDSSGSVVSLHPFLRSPKRESAPAPTVTRQSSGGGRLASQQEDHRRNGSAISGGFDDDIPWRTASKKEVSSSTAGTSWAARAGVTSIPQHQPAEHHRENGGADDASPTTSQKTSPEVPPTSGTAHRDRSTASSHGTAHTNRQRTADTTFSEPQTPTGGADTHHQQDERQRSSVISVPELNIPERMTPSLLAHSDLPSPMGSPPGGARRPDGGTPPSVSSEELREKESNRARKKRLSEEARRAGEKTETRIRERLDSGTGEKTALPTTTESVVLQGEGISGEDGGGTETSSLIGGGDERPMSLTTSLAPSEETAGSAKKKR